MASLVVRVTPRAARDALAGYSGGVLHVRVTAPPAEGAANAAVVRLLARTLRLPSRDIVLASGANARLKRFEVPLDPAGLERILLAAAPDVR